MTSITSIKAAALIAAVAGSAAFAATASAATMSCTTSGKGNSAATFSLTDSIAAECYSGNDTNQIDSNFSLFGKTGWTLSDKNDDGTSGDQTITFGVAPVNGTKSGPWSINGYTGLRDVAITLKAGNGFGAFLLDLTSAGTWSSSKDLSHASIYYNGQPTPPPAPIPLPAAAWMLLAGLGGLGAVARRRKTV